MTSADAMRASDADREKVVHALQEQVGEGRLTLEEFEQRTTQVYVGKTVGDLRALTADLPVDPLAPPLTAAPPWQQQFTMPVIPPWAMQRGFPPANNPRSSLPQRRKVHPLAIAGIVLLSLFLVQGVIGAIAFGVTAGVFPMLPLLFLLFFLLRGGGRRRYR